MALDDPRITQIELTGYLNLPHCDLICKCCQEPIYQGDIYYSIADGVYCGLCLKEKFQRFA